jgi:hypothetical protein
MQTKNSKTIPSSEVRKYTLGADSGFAHGALCVIGEDLEEIHFFDIGEGTLSGLCSFIDNWSSRLRYAVLEKVNSSPMMGVVSAFNFGRGYGWLETLLTVHSIPFECVAPQKWLTIVGSRPVKETLPYDADQKERDKIRRNNKKEGKQATYTFCKKRFPRAELRSFSRDSNRADALAIAYWGSKEYNKV